MSAQARTIKTQEFFDFEYAMQLWNTVKTYEDMEVLYYCNENDDGVFDAWETHYGRNPQKAREALESHPQAEAIKQCYDNRLTYEAWGAAYRAWRNDLSTFGSGGWNSGEPCKFTVVAHNIFTGKCTDLPDWRHPENVIEDEKWIAEGSKHWWNKKAAE